MTQWGMLLLCAYIALGVGRSSWRKAGRFALVLTTVVIAVAMVSYLHSGPPAPSSNVGGSDINSAAASSVTGAAAGSTDPATSENTAGRQQELNNGYSDGSKTPAGQGADAQNPPGADAAQTAAGSGSP